MDTEAIGELARERFVEKSIAGMAASIGERPEDLQDLAQDIYIELMGKDLGKFEEMLDLKYYILRMISNNLISKTSRYYYKYKVHDKGRDQVDIGYLPSE